MYTTETNWSNEWHWSVLLHCCLSLRSASGAWSCVPNDPNQRNSKMFGSRESAETASRCCMKPVQYSNIMNYEYFWVLLLAPFAQALTDVSCPDWAMKTEKSFQTSAVRILRCMLYACSCRHWTPRSKSWKHLARPIFVCPACALLVFIFFSALNCEAQKPRLAP